MQAMLRGESLGMSEGVPALVEHQGGMMMIEPGAAQQPDSWAQDVPAAMRTPSLEARQVNAGFCLCSCMQSACFMWLAPSSAQLLCQQLRWSLPKLFS